MRSRIPAAVILLQQPLRPLVGRASPPQCGQTGSGGRARNVVSSMSIAVSPAGITSVVFDRAGNKYHGRIAALADAAREGGLDF